MQIIARTVATQAEVAMAVLTEDEIYPESSDAIVVALRELGPGEERTYLIGTEADTVIMKITCKNA